MPSLRCSRCRRTGTQIHPVDKYEVFIPVFGEDIGSSFDHASRLCERNRECESERESVSGWVGGSEREEGGREERERDR